MGTLDRFTLSVGVAAALAGCGSFQDAVPQNAAPQSTVQVAASSFAGEKFAFTYVSASCLLTPGGPLLKYTATGSAIGPLPGTFSASGTVLDNALKKTVFLDEGFEVYSGSRTFVGKVETDRGMVRFSGCRKALKSDSFRAKRVLYHVDHSRGKSRVYYSALHFDESFY